MRYILILLLIFTSAAHAAGPEKIATYDRKTWPEAIDSNAAFDRASAFEGYHFLDVLSAVDTGSAETIRAFTGVKEPDMASVKRWVRFARGELVKNFNATQRQDAKGWGGGSKIDSAETYLALMRPHYLTLSPEYDQWKERSRKFHTRYVYEQLRLAALFPRITSEILKLDQSERNGFELNDKQFILTFDDGPSPNGVTGKMISELNSRHLKAAFFLLGERLETLPPEKAQALYAGHYVGSHGYTHKAHPRYAQWQSSIDRTHALISAVFSTPSNRIGFRPPYGQRTPEMIAHLRTVHHSLVALWNIDSQDWNRKIGPDQLSDRVTTLILLWRKGIILFHDMYPKSIEAVGALHDFSREANIEFVDPG
ncbi:polysaccharide deacetylase family protein [Desulfoluna spongiiphila]|uniref:polysaccharide deacetylase family protein n=1 Tax=Desulfoluna spongiiphila TaxID=419481 RepID=UPI00125A18B9|nr:polysaccharide deacetylase family protein [Desulfoluna spongiiphila]VVS91916.1 glycoside hydrolase/deacetylase beta/alpha-barrel [Desulfoluna spongiiphila]